ncbi:MAG: hypothetical protein ACYDH4_10155 [Candidatus Cryosericum sp.]
MKKIVANGHVVRVREWDGTCSPWVEVTLDGFCLVVMPDTKHNRRLLDSMADSLAYALRAPERKKRVRGKVRARCSEPS